MVGTLTAQYDNPKLNVREWYGKNPVRVVIDRNLKLNPGLFLFDKSQTTLCYNQIHSLVEQNLEKVKLSEDFELEEIFEDLYHRQIQSIIVEGGAQILNKLIEMELWDEARVFTGNQNFIKGIPAPILKGSLISESNVMGDKISIWKPYH